MKRMTITLFAILALAFSGALLAQSGTNGTAPAGTAQTDPGQMSNNLNTPQNTNPSPANTDGMTTGTKPYVQPTGTAPTTTATTTVTTAPDQPTGVAPSATTAPDQTTSGTLDNSAAKTGSSYDTTGNSRLHETTNSTLPRTASELPLLAALGLVALSAGFAVRSRRNA